MYSFNIESSEGLEFENINLEVWTLMPCYDREETNKASIYIQLK